MNNYSDIQISILTKLLKSNGLKFSQAYPKEENIDSDLYNYHLQYLTKRGLVEKVDGLYQLTKQGRYAVQFFDSQGNYYPQFRLSVLMFVINQNNQILLQKRLRHPCMGDIGVPSGKIKPGETTVQAASRKLQEETGLKCDFKFVGTIRSIRHDSDGSLIEDPIFNIALGKTPIGQLQQETPFGLNFWTDFDTAIDYEKDNLACSKAHINIYKHLKDNKKITKFSHEETITLKGY